MILNAWPADTLRSVSETALDGNALCLYLNGSRLTVTRRPVIELPSLSARSSYASSVSSDDGLDVPAFLRRKDG